jgi:glycosyltransferase A (GT-A) superfamily protein (DUF2064 family)
LDRIAPFLPADGIELRPQKGADLWGRMEHCIDELCGEGHSPVILRNTDSPDLDEDVVQQALAGCSAGRVVLGPDDGGGYYLIGVAEPCPELFVGLEEGAASVFDGTVGRARTLGLDLVILPERPDVDTFDDLVAMWRRRLGATAP